VGSILPFVPRVVFDDADTRVMGEAFDAACKEVRDTGQPPLVREVMAKKIIDAARAGERDVNRLRDAALSGLRGSRGRT
jgi:hypothetical protein